MRTILLNLPLDCRGYIVQSIETDECCCVLNARLSHEQNQRTYLHELEHLTNNDLDSDMDANTLESLRHEE